MSDLLLLNQVATQLSLRGWVDPVPDLIQENSTLQIKFILFLIGPENNKLQIKRIPLLMSCNY